MDSVPRSLRLHKSCQSTVFPNIRGLKAIEMYDLQPTKKLIHIRRLQFLSNGRNLTDLERDIGVGVPTQPLHVTVNYWVLASNQHNGPMNEVMVYSAECLGSHFKRAQRRRVSWKGDLHRPSNMHIMYIYCHIVEYAVVGDPPSPCIRCLPIMPTK